MDFSDLAQYSEQMPGRKSGDQLEKKPRMSGLSMASGALQGMGAGLMGDELYKKYSRAGNGYQSLLADQNTMDNLVARDTVHVPGEVNPDRQMAENMAKRERIKTSSNMGGKLR